MKHFMSLVCFEYRKIWNKKSAVLTLALVLFFSIISVWGTLLGNAYIDGEIYESNYEGMIKDREYARAITGRALDSALLLEAAAAYASIPEDANVYQSTEEFKKNARHYSAIYVIARQVYRNSSKQFGPQEFGKLTPLQAEQFYEARRETVEQIIDSTQMSSKAKNYLLEQAVFIHGLCVFFACLFTAAVTMVLSAKLRSPFGVIILVSILLFLPLIIRMPVQPLLPYQLCQLLPSNMMEFESIIDILQYEIFGLVIPPYIMMPAFAIVCAAALTPFTFRAFKKHQIT